MSRTITANVPTDKLRSFVRDLRKSGYFVVQSAPAGAGYAVTYVPDPR